MDETSYKLSLIAYYLSEFDMQAVHTLGYSTRNDAMRNISARLGRDNQYLKLRRDEFDVLTNSTRRGWANRSPSGDVLALFNEFSAKSFTQLTELIKGILHDADKNEAVQEKSYMEDVNQAVDDHSGTKIMRDHPVDIRDAFERTAILYRRNPKIAANALFNADYQCEADPSHDTFLRRSNGKPYTEPHHLVPLKFQSEFSVSLDVENNILSLCSNCHNKLHYGAEIDGVLHELFCKRKDLLSMAGINITFKQLQQMYR